MSGNDDVLKVLGREALTAMFEFDVGVAVTPCCDSEAVRIHWQDQTLGFSCFVCGKLLFGVIPKTGEQLAADIKNGDTDVKEG